MLIKLLVIGDYIMEFVAQWQDLPNTQKYTALSFACFPGFFFLHPVTHFYAVYIA